MSKLFFDHLISLDEVEKEINKVSTSKEEKDELWRLVDEIIHHKVMGCVLEKLPRDDHEEFLDLFEKHPHDEAIFGYLADKIGKNIEELIKQEIGNLAFEILNEIRVKAEKE